MQRASITFGALVAATLAAGLSGTALAQSGPDDHAPPETQQNAPLDVPPEFLKPENPQAAPPNAPAAAPQNEADDAPPSGAWEFSNADRDKVCHFNFRDESLAGGHRLDIDKNCPNLFPSTRDIVAWASDHYGNLRLLDAGGNAVIEMTEVEGGMFDGFSPEEGRYILQSAAAAVPAHSAEDMAGDWTVSRGGGAPICALTLANSPAGANLALKIKPGCDAFVTRFGPTAWRIDEGELVLLSARGQTWQFEEAEADSWQRVPETADRVVLTRQQ